MIPAAEVLKKEGWESVRRAPPSSAVRDLGKWRVVSIVDPLTDRSVKKTCRWGLVVDLAVLG